MALRYRALLLANWEYKDETDRLKGPKHDIAALREALVHPEYGLFLPELVEVHENLSNAELGTAIENFLKSAMTEDYLLVYYSGHGGLRSADDMLALVGVDTVSVDAHAFSTDQLPAWIKDKARNCPTAMILDCCYAGQAGAFKGGKALAAGVEPRVPEGICVLTSSGRTPALDAETADKPSPFTDALAKILQDPAVRGDSDGRLTPYRVQEELDKVLPAGFRPHLKGQTTAGFGLAKRPRPSDGQELPGWRDDQAVDPVDLVFESSGTSSPGSNGDVSNPYDRFDERRRWAIRRLTHLADGVMRQKEVDKESVDAVRKAWQCIGENLFETVLPEDLQARVRRRDDGPGSPLLKLRLRFDNPEFEDYPWEYLHDPEPPAYDDAFQQPFGLRPGILVERCAPPFSAPSSTPVSEVVVINAYKDALDAMGNRLAGDLRKIFEPETVKSLRGGEANWSNVSDTFESKSRYLVLIAPLLRVREEGQQQKAVSIGFAKPLADEPDWLRANKFVARLVATGSVFDCIVIVTYAAEPGRDSYRGALHLSAQLARAKRGPVAFVCHEQGYLDYLEDQPHAQVFPELLIRALRRGKRLDESFAWARDRVIGQAGEMANTFGVPGLYAPLSEEPSVSGAVGTGSSSGLTTPPPAPSKPKGPQ